jgi:hypothetical protein
MLRYRITQFFQTCVMEVFHQDSPGMRVYVKRTWWQRLLFNSTFSEVGERHLPCSEAKNCNCMIRPLRLSVN